MNFKINKKSGIQVQNAINFSTAKLYGCMTTMDAALIYIKVNGIITSQKAARLAVPKRLFKIPIILSNST